MILVKVMNEHPKYKGYYGTAGGDIYNKSFQYLIPQWVETTHKTKIGHKRIGWNKFLMECHLGRELDKKEVVVPKDGNPRNHKLSNLELKSKSQHQREVMYKRWAK